MGTNKDRRVEIIWEVAKIALSSQDNEVNKVNYFNRVSRLMKEYEANNWFSVSKFLPKADKVIVLTKSEHGVAPTEFSHQSNGKITWTVLTGVNQYEDYEEAGLVTHWRPLPEFKVTE